MSRDPFFSLVPERIKFGQFWVEIRKRNRWLIMLRYIAIAMLSVLILGMMGIKLISPQVKVDVFPLWIIAFAILCYNVFFHVIWNYLAKKRNWFSSLQTEHPSTGFHSLHFALIQICFDFLSLLLFIYYTGGVESPIYIFFIFHVIIGSLFLTQEVTASIVTVMLMASVTGSILEAHNLIRHHAIEGLLSAPLYNNTAYLIVFFAIFGGTLYISIYLANSIARTLYQRERLLTRAYSDLENAEKSKSKYVQRVVHDLKTPIAAAVTYLDMILSGNLGSINETQQKPLERSKARLSSAIHTINDILEISQLKIESSIENVEEINITLIFAELISDVTDLTESKNIELNYTCDSLEPFIEAEPKLLKLALANIVSNAVKYTDPEGKIEIIISDEKDSCKISVADNGIGIPEKEQEKIFQSFYRSSLSKQRGIEGTGLGMSIVWEVIQKYHGTVELISPCYLKSGPDKPGSQFVVTIPRKFKII